MPPHMWPDWATRPITSTPHPEDKMDPKLKIKGWLYSSSVKHKMKNITIRTVINFHNYLKGLRASHFTQTAPCHLGNVRQ